MLAGRGLVCNVQFIILVLHLGICECNFSSLFATESCYTQFQHNRIATRRNLIAEIRHISMDVRINIIAQ